MDKKKILLVGPYPPPFGGISSHLMNIVPYLLEAGFEIFFLTFSQTDVIEHPTKGVTVYRVNVKQNISDRIRRFSPLSVFTAFAHFLAQGFNFKNALAELMRYLTIREIVDRHKIGIVSCYKLQSGFFVPIMKKQYGDKIALCTTILGEFYEEEREILSIAPFVRKVLTASDSVMSSSIFCAKGVERVGFPYSRVNTIYYGVDLERFDTRIPAIRDKSAELRKKMGIAEDQRVVLFVARLNAEMGLDMVLEAIPKVLANNQKITFLIAGATSDMSSQVHAFSKRYPEKVIVRENAPASEIPLYYAICEFLIAPSKANHPCMGVSIKEAMASGRATIATIAGGIPEAVINGETGFLVKTLPDLRADQAEFIEKLLLLTEDAELSRRLGRQARVKAEELFDNRVTAAKVISVFKGL